MELLNRPFEEFKNLTIRFPDNTPVLFDIHIRDTHLEIYMV